MYVFIICEQILNVSISVHISFYIFLLKSGLQISIMVTTKCDATEKLLSFWLCNIFLNMAHDDDV